MKKDEREALIQEGRNQILYILLSKGDEEVAHDNWHPDRAHRLYELRVEICEMLKQPRPNGVMNIVWPPAKEDGTRDWPDFEKYTYCAG